MTSTIDTPTQVRPIPGQVWSPVHSSLKVLILAVVEPEEGAPHVLHRYEYEDVGASLDVTPLDKFLAGHENPTWSAPPIEETTRYVIAYGSRQRSSESWGTAAEAHDRTYAYPNVIGVLRVDTVQRYEWAEVQS